MQKIMVWDVPTRLFHWLAVVLVTAAYATWRLNWMDWHAYAGYALLALVVFRLFWGFFGGETARFARSSPRRKGLPAISRSCSDESPTVRLATIRPAAGW